jgi:cell division protein FtsI/penicillin-binding protein 2
VRRFGFGRTLLPDLTGESPGIVWSTLSDSALASVSMGYQIGVTPLQMAAAFSSIANGGELVQPRLVRAVRGATDRQVPSSAWCSAGP